MATSGLVVIDDTKIRAMLADSSYTAQFPCLRAAASALSGIPQKCGRCQARRAAERTKIYRSVRQCLSGLEAGQRKKLKTLLAAEKVRIIRMKGKSTIKITF